MLSRLPKSIRRDSSAVLRRREHDEENNLIGLFKWDNILGFTTEGSAKDQVITDKIPLEMGKVPDDELGVSGRTHLESIRQQLERLSGLDLEI